MAVQMTAGYYIFTYLWRYLEQMRAAVTVGTSETVHLRDPSALFYQMCQIAFGDEIGIGFPRLGTVAGYREEIDVPFQAFLMCQMTSETLIEARHGTAHVTVCASSEKVRAFGPHGDVYVPVEGDEKNIGPLPDGHWEAFRESS